MRLKKLFKNIEYNLHAGSDDIEIHSIAYDSRDVKEGTLFVCLCGEHADGHDFIEQAVKMGATAIVFENTYVLNVQQENAAKNIVMLGVDDTRKALAYLSAAWYSYPADAMTMIGITGTKGKTTTAHMIKRILEKDGFVVGMIGTLGAYIGDEKYPTKNTTPESYELHHLFYKMREAGCTHVVMEVSSQALKQHRTDGITFEYGAFLNISPDHIGIGEHVDFNEYFECKKQLFKQSKQIIVNMDDPSWEEMTGGVSVCTTSREDNADYMGINIHNTWEEGLLGVEFTLCGSLADTLKGGLSLHIPGDFNVENALIAIAITHQIGAGREAITKGLRTVYVKGRTQVIPSAAHFLTILIDYAHNALSMESLLKMLREYKPKRLICLFGGGGNKPKQRRYDMGAMAGKYSDLIILTTDNPRFEQVEDINQEIIKGIREYHEKYITILDREEAIHYLIDNCGKGDIVALIGKGHEEYQEIGSHKFFFSEEQIIEQYLLEK